MKVYVVVDLDENDLCILGVFTTENQAIERLKRHIAYEMDYDNWEDVTEEIIDEFNYEFRDYGSVSYRSVNIDDQTTKA